MYTKLQLQSQAKHAAAYKHMAKDLNHNWRCVWSSTVYSWRSDFCYWRMWKGWHYMYNKEDAHTPSVILICRNVTLHAVSLLYNSLHTGKKFMMLFCCGHWKRPNSPNRIFTTRRKSVNIWKNVWLFKKTFIRSQNNDLNKCTHNWNLCVTNTSVYKRLNSPYINCCLHCFENYWKLHENLA